MKTLLEKIVRRRNPDFRFDEALNSAMIRTLLLDRSKAVMRTLFRYPSQLLSGLMLGRGVRIMNKHNVRLGNWVKLDDFVTLNAMGREPLSIGNNSSIGAFSRVIISTSYNNMGAFIRIGNNVGIGEYAYLGGGGGLQIGDNCIIGQYLSCHPENHNYTDTSEQIRHQGVSRKGIVVGENCWIGAKVTIADGVHIGNNCVIAAGAVVTKNMPDYSLIGGVPARVLKMIR